MRLIPTWPRVPTLCGPTVTASRPNNGLIPLMATTLSYLECPSLQTPPSQRSPEDSAWKSNVRQQTDNHGTPVERSSLLMKQRLQQIDADYFRFVQLLIAHAELKQLRQWRIDVKRRSTIPLGMSRAPDRYRHFVTHHISSKRHPTSPRLPA
jgi:hypothetical protein